MCMHFNTFSNVLLIKQDFQNVKGIMGNLNMQFVTSRKVYFCNHIISGHFL